MAAILGDRNTSKHAVLRIASHRHEDHARELLSDSTAIVTSDRWWAYNHLPLARRQVCRAHLRRDFQAHAEGLAAEKEFGEHGLALQHLADGRVRSGPDDPLLAARTREQLINELVRQLVAHPVRQPLQGSQAGAPARLTARRRPTVPKHSLARLNSSLWLKA